ncbi:M18 family aminopeptidase [Marinobacterium sp. LSUCC0821]|jgi:aspartyl aminopeptidase|uniref:M18 family aminopeptidase n=1 Tax=Marinobacterium sp. LSUCC0821 TaxID=2668067 RepID=UPI001451B6FE|nr:M18 family aminopeptidase [Marinobacterium sp. LSUCC0821]QJD70733.1 M18 family aminopeptidase [Marinobacterium sp. LSUCC0821]
MDLQNFNQQLIDFIADSPTPFHAVESIKSRLDAAGFSELLESDSWSVKAGEGYYLVRNQSSIIAWRQPESFDAGIRMVGAHTDSPCLRVKPTPELYRFNYQQLGVEVYGGALLNPWFDRDLSLAGRVTCKTAAGDLVNKLIDFKDPIAVIPSLAIHMDREANDSRTVNKQLHLPVLMGQGEDKMDFRGLLKAQLQKQGVEVAQVLDYELSFYDTQRPAYIGLNQEFLASARLDNLLSCYISLQALIAADKGQAQMLICTDHEEVGSASACGAQGPILSQWLERLVPDNELRNRLITQSVMISADNAHGIHPNYADRHDENHGPLLNKGPVIKINSNQRYATNSETSSLFRDIAQEESVPVQAFVVRSDLGCGSTIGPITASEVGVRTVDIGVPQFAMHSIREIAGSEDAHYLFRILKRFYVRAKV